MVRTSLPSGTMPSAACWARYLYILSRCSIKYKPITFATTIVRTRTGPAVRLYASMPCNLSASDHLSEEPPTYSDRLKPSRQRDGCCCSIIGLGFSACRRTAPSIAHDAYLSGPNRSATICFSSSSWLVQELTFRHCAASGRTEAVTT